MDNALARTAVGARGSRRGAMDVRSVSETSGWPKYSTASGERSAARSAAGSVSAGETRTSGPERSEASAADCGTGPERGTFARRLQSYRERVAGTKPVRERWKLATIDDRRRDPSGDRGTAARGDLPTKASR